MSAYFPPGAAGHWRVTGERACDYCGVVRPVADLDGDGRCEPCRPSCEALFRGAGCSGEPGHPGGHWTDQEVWAA